MIDKFKSLQENEVRSLLQRLQAYPPCLKRHSGEYFRLRRVQKCMSAQKMYEEAWDAKLEADRLEQLETEKWQQQVERKINVMRDQLLARQKVELENFEKKLVVKNEDRFRLRNVEYDKLFKRYQNGKRDLELQ